MITFARYVLLLTTLLSSLLAFPILPRDVVDPPITNPTAATVWRVGQTATVTWNTTGLPVNQTNPVGMLVLGYWYNNSENLMLDSPLATNINYSVGQAQITVPNVPTRTDYIVVLFGDSGNASPEFTIINGASSPTAVPSPSPTNSQESSPAPAPASTPSSGNSGSPGNSGGSSPTSAGDPPATAVSLTTTTPSSQPTVPASTVVAVTSSVTPSSVQSSAAWQTQDPSLATFLSVALAFICFTFS